MFISGERPRWQPDWSGECGCQCLPPLPCTTGEAQLGLQTQPNSTLLTATSLDNCRAGPGCARCGPVWGWPAERLAVRAVRPPLGTADIDCHGHSGKIQRTAGLCSRPGRLAGCTRYWAGSGEVLVDWSCTWQVLTQPPDTCHCRGLQGGW